MQSPDSSDTPETSHTRPCPQAIEIFCRYLRNLEVDPELDFEGFKREHGEHAGDLAQLLEQYERVTAILDRLTPSASFSARLREHYGDSVDPGISLDGPGPSPRSASQGSSGKALARLSAQHPSTSRYDTKHELARGGMGAIMEVWDKELRRTLAMKVVLGGTPVEGSSQSTEERVERRLSRFLEEAQITGQLDHPGIVPVHDIGIDESGRVYFTMQLVDGHDLRKVFELARLNKDGWSLSRVVSVFVRVCEAMAYAHAKGVVHRDIKPANIMVGAFGEAFVMDWGLAKVVDDEETEPQRERRKSRTKSKSSTRVRTNRSDSDSTQDDALRTLDGDVVGTPAYMAPEQARGALAEVGTHSDIYAMGAMLYHLLAGQAPYEPLGEKVPAHTVLDAVRKAPPWPLVRIQPDVDGELAAICEKAMSREIGARYGSMMELSEDLRAWVEGRGVKAYTTGTLYDFRKWVMRNKLLAFSLGVLPLVVIGSLVVLSVQQRHSLEDLFEEQAKTETARTAAVLAREEADENAQAAREGEANMRREKIRADEAAATARGETERADAEALTAGIQRKLATFAQQHAEIVAYRSLVTAAAYSLQLNDATLADANLKACEYRLRGWEWNHVSLAMDFSVGRKLIEENSVTDLAVSADGKTLLTYGWGISPQLWDLSDRRPFKRVFHHPGFLGFGPQNRFDYLRTALSPNGAVFAVTDPQLSTVKMFNAATADEMYVFKGHTKPVTALNFNPAGDLLVTASEDGTAVVMRPLTMFGDRVVATLEVPGVPLFDAAFDPKGEVIATSGADGTLRLWGLDGQLLHEFGGYHGDSAVALDWSPDGKRIVTGCHDGGLAVWDVESGSLVTVMNGHRGKVHDVLFSLDGRSVFSASEDHTVRIWEAANGKPLGVLNGHEGPVRSLVRVGQRGEVASCSMDRTVRFWNANWNPGLTSLPVGTDESYRQVAFGADNRTVLALTPELLPRKFDADRGESLAVSASAASDAQGGSTGSSAVALASGGGRYAVAKEKGVVHVIDSATQASVAQFEGLDGHLTRLAISEDGSRVATSSRRGPLYSIDVATGERVELPLERYLEALAVSADGAWVATVESDDKLRLFDARSGELLATSGRAHSQLVTKLSFASDGRSLASSSRDSTARIWQVPSLEFLAPELEGRGELLTSVSVCSANNRVATGSARGRVQIWSLEDRELLYSELVTPDPIVDLNFSPDGKRLVISSGTAGLRVLESSKGDTRYSTWFERDSEQPAAGEDG